MASLLYKNPKEDEEIPEYFKNRKYDLEKLKTSTCLYIGNSSFYTTETQIFELFSKCGLIRRIIMGLNKYSSTPCGFCFVEYEKREDANIAILTLNHTILDNRLIRVDWDIGFEEGRQYGRGTSGNQRREDIRKKNDPGRNNKSYDGKYLRNKRDRDRNKDY